MDIKAELQLRYRLEVEMEKRKQEEEEKRAKGDYDLFAEKYIKIVNKDTDTVPFKHNSIQNKINAKVKELQDQGKPVRIIIAKARQQGVSTNEQGRMVWNTTQHKNTNALIVADDDKATNAIFEKAKYMVTKLPDNIRPLQRASNAKEIIFDKPTGYKGEEEGLNSKISVQVAGKTNIGRGDTYTHVHLSEFAYWKGAEGQGPLNQLTGILQAVPKITESIVIIESTAQGFNDFKTLWDSAMTGKTQWVPMFFPWHEYEDYRMEVTELERKEIMSSLNEYETEIVKLYDITAEQIKWYRWMLENDCHGDENLMKQENPTFPEEAFVFSGSPVFNTEIIMRRIEFLRKEYEKKPPKKGYFIFEWHNAVYKDKIVNSTIKFIPSKSGSITIYEDVLPGVPYVIGGDTKGDGSDFFAGTVKNNNTGKRCCTLHSDMSPDEYTHQMYCLGKYYNDALIGIEVNFDIYPIKELERLGYANQYMRQHFDSMTNEYQKKYGWKTDGNTRPLIISKQLTLLRDNIDLFTDMPMLQECITFVKDKDGRPDAMSGKHDDLLFSDMICNECSSQQESLYNPMPVPMVPGGERERTGWVNGTFVHPSMVEDRQKKEWEEDTEW